MNAYELYISHNIEINGTKLDISRIASWTIWAQPKNGNWSSKDTIEDMSVFNDDLDPNLFKSKYIFVGLNPANHRTAEDDNSNASSNVNPIAWSGFHSGCKKKSQDYKLRKVFYHEGDNNEGYKSFQGSLIIDLNYKCVETVSRKVLGMTSDFEWEKRVEDLLAIWKELGGNAVIVPMGQVAYDKICLYRKKHQNDVGFPKDLKIRGIRHFSAPGYIKFKNAVRQLSEDALGEIEPCMYKGYADK